VPPLAQDRSLLLLLLLLLLRHLSGTTAGDNPFFLFCQKVAEDGSVYTII